MRVSIRALAWRAIRPCCRLGTEELTVSIRAPRVEGDPYRAAKDSSLDCTFQSAPSRGGRLGSPAPGTRGAGTRFNPPPSRGGRYHYLVQCLVQLEAFSIRGPRVEGDGHPGPALA